MNLLVWTLMLGVILGLVSVASNPSPYYGALGLVLAAGMACGVLMTQGGMFLSLVLFLIYLGGMLVVFAYSAALAAEPFPESWNDGPVLVLSFIYVVVVVMSVGYCWGGWYGGVLIYSEEVSGFGMCRGDTSGVAQMYAVGGGYLVIGAWVLLLTLFAVLEISRGLSRGALRAV